MNTSDSLYAEQSIFASLVVKKQPPKQTIFQRATLGETSIYNYNFIRQQQLTNIDPSIYSIINLPDTIAFIPKCSVFDNILLIRSSSPDYRFIKIASSTSKLDSLKRTSVVSDKDLKVKRFKDDTEKQSIFTTMYNIKDYKDNNDRRNDGNDDDDDNSGGGGAAAAGVSSAVTSGSNISGSGSGVDNEGGNENAQEDIEMSTADVLAVSSAILKPTVTNDIDPEMIDAVDALNFKFRNFDDVSSYSDIEILMVDISEIVKKFPAQVQKEQQITWVQALRNMYAFKPEIANSRGKNPRTALYKIINYIEVNVKTPYQNNFVEEEIVKMKQMIDSYVS